MFSLQTKKLAHFSQTESILPTLGNKKRNVFVFIHAGIRTEDYLASAGVSAEK
jgi:hypothetical protein